MIMVPEAFDKFRKKLELTETEKKDAQKRHTEVRGCLRAEFDIKRDFLTGSYGRHTKTKPLKDIDIFFVLGPKENYRKKEAPSKTLDAFEKCLIDRYGSDKVERGRRCVTVVFDKVYQTQEEDGKVLSIDAVPAFESNGHFDIPDDITGEWIASDPEIHAQQATDKNKELGNQWKPLVKMLKRWNSEAKKPIKPSFLLEVMAQDLVDGPFSTYPDEIINFFSNAHETIGDVWPDPAGLGPPVSDQMDQNRINAAKEALRNAEKIADRAKRAESLGKTSEALALWRQLFGSYNLKEHSMDIVIDIFKSDVFAIVGGILTIIAIVGLAASFFTTVWGTIPILIRLGSARANKKIALFEQNNDLFLLLSHSKLVKEKNITRIEHADSIPSSESKDIFIIHWDYFGDHINEILSKVGDFKSVIIYAKPGAIKDFSEISKHRNAVVVNFRGRLLGDLLASLMTTGH